MQQEELRQLLLDGAGRQHPRQEAAHRPGTVIHPSIRVAEPELEPEPAFFGSSGAGAGSGPSLKITF